MKTSFIVKVQMFDGAWIAVYGTTSIELAERELQRMLAQGHFEAYIITI